ncbi:MAG: hypothetical protein H0X56_05800 [Solirubrobacterales bacterium]|nr:hypothetical protein [Solirubrobacterales bacterium]
MTRCPAAYEHFATKRDLQRALLEGFMHEALGAVASAFSAAQGTEARLRLLSAHAAITRELSANLLAAHGLTGCARAPRCPRRRPEP